MPEPYPAPCPVSSPVALTEPAERLFVNLCCELRAKLVPPAAHLIMADFDSAFAHQISDVARRQRGPAVKQGRQTDELWVLLEVAKKPMFGHG